VASVRDGELFCPFPLEINPHAARANQHMLEWAARFGLIASPHAVNSGVLRMNYGWLGARVHPNASLEALQIATEWQCWLFCGDDKNDESPDGRDPVEMKRVHERFLSVLAGASPTAHDSAAAHALADLRDRIRLRASPAGFARFTRRIRDYFAAIRWEAGNRAGGVVPDLDTYCRMRLDTSAVYTCFELIEVTEEIVLPATVHDHPHTRQMGRLANNVTSWCNDIVSANKEREQGDVHNLVIVLQHHHRMSLADTVAAAIRMHNAAVAAYLELEARLPSFGGPVDAALQRYVRGLRSWMRGNMDWGLTARRYVSRTSPERQRPAKKIRP